MTSYVLIVGGPKLTNNTIPELNKYRECIGHVCEVVDVSINMVIVKVPDGSDSLPFYLDEVEEVK